MIKTCECCGKIINPLIIKDEVVSDSEIYYEDDDSNICYCEDCGNEILKWSSDIRYFVDKDEYKETYLDDELSDITIFHKYDVDELDAVEPDPEEPDYDGYCKDIQLGI